ncbi:MAG: DUF4157 domain-containing protein [Gemmatimonadota bacterium]|nr:DUF4157 domain-containing protein [Gemmatimonadota bacterium]
MLDLLKRAVAGSPIRIDPRILDDYPELAAVRWRRGGLAVRIGGWALGQSAVAGITLGRTVFLQEPEKATVRLLLHELGHVRQFQRDKAFPMRYLWESIRRGYARNRFEAEADQFAEEVLWSSTQRRPS